MPAIFLLALLAALLYVGPADAQAPAIDAARMEAAVKRSWTQASPEWQTRLGQDETMVVCSQHRNSPPPAVADAILAREKASIKYPGTLGPSLLEYGKIRKFSDADIKAVYDRIYNPQAAVACASMPRLGAGGHLSIEQIKDLVAYVMSPDSPVNK